MTEINIGNLKITKLPESIDVKKIADDKMMHSIFNHYSTCPICGNNDNVFMNYSGFYPKRQIGMEPKTARYGYQKGLPFWKRFFASKLYWCINSFRCKNCGCEWESPEYPLFEVPKGFQNFMWHGRLLRSDEYLY